MLLVKLACCYLPATGMPVMPSDNERSVSFIFLCPVEAISLSTNGIIIRGIPLLRRSGDCPS